MKKIFSLALLLPVFLCSNAQDDVTKEKFTPFYETADAPHMEKVLPAPPSLTDSRYFYDWTQYQWGKSIRETERGQQAIADAGICARLFGKDGAAYEAELKRRYEQLRQKYHEQQTRLGSLQEARENKLNLF